MSLLPFLQALFTTGQITLSEAVQPYPEDDLRQSALLLEQAHQRAARSMPAPWPGHHAEAALWAAQWMHRALQVTFLRDVPNAEVRRVLEPYRGSHSAEAVASADLTLQRISAVEAVARHLSPEDELVGILHQTAARWPLSSVGIKGIKGALDHGTVLRHPGLRAALRDRVIRHQDAARLSDPAVCADVQAALGEHANTLWPGFTMLSLPTHG